ncbi:hypothetical protein [Alterisphingorhabdus coralli]|uniref:Uncharacterized protein n=1 Tax=Alterisphingorhabdus coralli TaxID=3071408 RepID=A0AA97I1D5_9SPHN|nr:hypothetical protein [Parasphingorhabdus sp. SCSIO 66989]WOE75273.1 hypothetical protein RB602_00710 [Parasphingorhabdus sp. SCSIO 66989]
MSGRHEDICRKKAQIIVHNTAQWDIYQEAANRAYLERAKEFPNTRRMVAEHIPGFEFKFGSNLEDTPKFIDGEIVRDDYYIIKNGLIIAQYVDFRGSYKTIGYTQSMSCIGLYPELYSGEPVFKQ